MTKEELIKELENTLENIEYFQKGKIKSRKILFKNANNFKKLFDKYLNESFITRIKDKNNKKLKIGDYVSFKNFSNETCKGTIIGYERCTNGVIVRYGDSCTCEIELCSNDLELLDC